MSGSDEPLFNCLTKEGERAVGFVFEACKLTGASLVTAHRVAAMVADELEKIEARKRAGDNA
jgi:hypothetical protein